MTGTLPRVLVTGAAGLLGSQVLATLQSRGVETIAFTHRRHAPGACAGPGVRGDLTRHQLGLTPAEYERLGCEVDLIVHCAAITEFGKADHVYDEVNLGGTRNIAAFAMENGRRIPLVHVSTAYVCGNRRGPILETELNCRQRFSNAYEASKFRAEEYLQEQRQHGLRLVIVRPSIVVGAQETGAIGEFGNIYTVLKVLLQGRVTRIPGAYGATLDLVPIDYATESIVEAALRFQSLEGRVLHAVSAQPLSLLEVSDVIAEYPSFRAPRFIPPENFEAESLPARERGFYEKIVRLYNPYLQSRMVFSDAATRSVLSVRPKQQGKPLLRALLDYAVGCGFLRPRSDGGLCTDDQ